jgi:L-serine dehydratase
VLNMSNLHPSIFNDVIGPVMRGPSSSHCAAALRIGLIARALMQGVIDDVLVECDAQGSLALTFDNQGSDIGLWGGLLGWDATNDRLAQSGQALHAAGVTTEVRVGDFGDIHPNTYRLTLKNSREKHKLVAISTGGGMIEIISIDDVPITILGDQHETLIFLGQAGLGVLTLLERHLADEKIKLNSHAGVTIVQVRGKVDIEELLAPMKGQAGQLVIRTIEPVMPVLAMEQERLPFLTCQEMLEYNAQTSLTLWQLAVKYESARGGMAEGEVFDRMRQIAGVMRRAIDAGLAGTEYDDRILGWQSGKYQELMEQGRLLDAGVLNAILLAVTATMECKSSMGLVVAAPTAGSCGVLPGTCVAAAEFLGLEEDAAVKALLAAGIIGVFIARGATFSAEIGGCQAECGSASGMSAAGLVTLAGGSLEQAVAAASMALQSSLGMICDPIANRVEAPCLGKNAMAAANALSAANMALAGFDHLIPFDEVLAAMDQVGRSLPHALRCTGLGGLSLTKTSRAIEERLKQARK